MVRLELPAPSVEFVEFNNCAGPTLVTTSDVAGFACSPTTIFNIHNPTEWASLTPPVAAHPHFQCAPVISGGFAVNEI